MNEERTVIHVQSIDEATEQLDLPVEDPANGEDGGLVAEGEAYARIEFIETVETIEVARTVYDRLLGEYPAKEFTLENPTKEILDIGSDAVLDLKNGEVPLEGITNVLPKAVGSVFAMQANEGMRDWPAVPEDRTSSDAVPEVTAVEPVYPDLDAGTSRWVSCALEWDPEREVFVNSQADSDWELDEEASADAEYKVQNQSYGSVTEAMAKALEGTEWEQASPTVVVEPDEDKSPEWGPAV